MNYAEMCENTNINLLCVVHLNPPQQGRLTMAFTVSELMEIFPNHLWLEISEQAQEDCWQIAQQYAANPHDRWTTYLNTLSLHCFLDWFQTEFSQQAVQFDTKSARSSSGIVLGTPITVSHSRIVLIPDDKSNISEFYIPQEWITDKAWASDYYLAVQLDLEAGWLRVWGYATSPQIREYANYDRISQSYTLAAEDLIENLNILWVTEALRSPQDLAIGLSSQVKSKFRQSDLPQIEEVTRPTSDDVLQQQYPLHTEKN